MYNCITNGNARQIWAFLIQKFNNFQQFLTNFSHYIDSAMDYQTFEPSVGLVKEPSKVNFWPLFQPYYKWDNMSLRQWCIYQYQLLYTIILYSPTWDHFVLQLSLNGFERDRRPLLTCQNHSCSLDPIFPVRMKNKKWQSGYMRLLINTVQQQSLLQNVNNKPHFWNSI